MGFAPSAAGALTLLAGPVRVIDGDSLEIDGLRLRMHGIDAPELRQTCPAQTGGDWSCGVWARDRMRSLTAGKTLHCTVLGQDRYRRHLVRCKVDGRDLAAEMVLAGAATAYRKYSRDYVKAEDMARGQGLGVWQAGGLQRPEDHRRASSDAGSDPPGGCTINPAYSPKSDLCGCVRLKVI